ncbi:type II toxin-antitoxin system RelE/ParE family toxin [Pandoraea capi]|uniref:type II toxin-antitoxin system RelE/ParE family toxin n=1 Tax=Pandoraea TaxID=93217 RepID=UPI001F5D4D3D|nr:type II toxin-antitoxin system RelE/ParE family toxin [Pandoraea capi]
MSATILWSKLAQRDRIIARTSLANFNLNAALAFENAVRRSVNMLRTFPSIGRPGHIPNTRELVSHKRYRMIYRLMENEVLIMKLHNVSRPWPPKNHHFHD